MNSSRFLQWLVTDSQFIGIKNLVSYLYFETGVHYFDKTIKTFALLLFSTSLFYSPLFFLSFPFYYPLPHTIPHFSHYPHLLFFPQHRNAQLLVYSRILESAYLHLIPPIFIFFHFQCFSPISYFC